MYVRMEGGSFGALIGAAETGMVRMVMNPRGAKLMKSEFALGAATAGLPVALQKLLPAAESLCHGEPGEGS